MTPAQIAPAGRRLYAAALVVATLGGLALTILGAWLATHPEAGAPVELARVVTGAGVALVVVASATVSWRRS